MRKSISILLILSIMHIGMCISLGQTKQQRRPKVVRASTTISAPIRVPRPLALLRSSELPGGAQLTVTSDGPINKYDTYQINGRFYIRVSGMDSRIIEKGLQARGFDDLQVNQDGEDIILSFRLNQGTSASVSKKFNRLDVTISQAGSVNMRAATSTLMRGEAEPSAFIAPTTDALLPVKPPLPQDQVETVNDPLRSLSYTTGIDQENAKIIGIGDGSPNDSARSIIEKTLGSKVLEDPDFYCIIHVVRWQWNRQTLTKDPVVAAQNWYIYHRTTKFEETGWGTKKFNGDRIYGSKNIGLLYIYLNTPSTTQAQIDANATAKGEITQRKIARIVGGKSVVQLGDTSNFVVQDYLRIAYKVSVTKKLPAPVQNAIAGLGLLQGETPQVTLEAHDAVNLWGGRVMTLTPRPADISVQAFLGTNEGGQMELGKKTFDNEQRYRYDFSAGVPVRGVKELQFNAENNTVGARKIERQNVYAFFDFYPVPTDTKGLGFMKVPGFIFGLPIKGKAFDHPVAGLNFGLNRVQLFGGIVFNRERVPNTLNEGDPATQNQLENDFRTRYVRKFIWGINMPLRQVKEALK